MFGMKRNWMLFMFFAFIVVSAGFVSIYDSRNDTTIGGEGLETVDVSQCSDEAQRAAGYFENVYSCDSRELSSFTVVDLGSDPLNDCPAGCFASVYRFAVNDTSASYIGAKYGELDSLDGRAGEDETLVPLEDLAMNASMDDLAARP